MNIRVTAPAKINLSLHVLGKRGDGFHEIRTVFQALDLGDEVEVGRGGEGIELQVLGPDLGPTEDNLAYRAADAFLRASGERRGARVVLKKRVPAGAGLGGGSSDAAAVLRALARESSLPADPALLMRIGATLGSDVPFFLGDSPLARALGRGEVLEPLPPLPEGHLVLALPPIHVATAEAYAALGRPSLTDRSGDPSQASEGGWVDTMPGTWDDVVGLLHNDFEVVVAGRYPEVRRSLDALREAGALGVSLSGSGAGCFGVFANRAEASDAADTLTLEVGWPFLAVRTLTRWPEPLVDEEPRSRDP